MQVYLITTSVEYLFNYVVNIVTGNGIQRGSIEEFKSQHSLV